MKFVCTQNVRRSRRYKLLVLYANAYNNYKILFDNVDGLVRNQENKQTALLQKQRFVKFPRRISFEITHTNVLLSTRWRVRNKNLNPRRMEWHFGRTTVCV